MPTTLFGFCVVSGLLLALYGLLNISIEKNQLTIPSQQMYKRVIIGIVGILFLIGGFYGYYWAIREGSSLANTDRNSNQSPSTQNTYSGPTLNQDAQSK
jgi:hypothetical protein